MALKYIFLKSYQKLKIIQLFLNKNYLIKLFKEELGNLTKTLSQQKTELLEQIKERQIQSGQQSEELTSTAKNAREILVESV